MLKDIIEFILLSIVFTFVMNTVRRVLFPPRQQFRSRNAATERNDFQQKKTNENNKHGLNWDAEEAEYEEIKDENK